MSELSDEASESEQLGASLSLWLGGSGGQLVRPEELDVPLDLHTACSIGQYDIVAECIRRGEVDLNSKNIGGWTPLMYAAYIGHDNIANLLLEAGVSVNATTLKGQTPLMLAASCGNESIAYFMLQGVKVDERNAKGETARTLAMLYGHTKIASLIDMHSMRLKPDLSSSEDSDSAPPRSRLSRSKVKGPSIHDGPQAIAKFRVGGTSRNSEPPLAPPGYVTFRDEGEQSEGICNRDVTSPINELDGQSNSSRDESPFFDNDMPTMRSSSSSSEGLPHMIGLSREASLESNEDSDQAKRSSSRRGNKSHHHKSKSRHGSSDNTGNCGILPPSSQDLAEFLEQIGFSKYLPLLEEQDIDLRIFLTLTENDLKEVGITLFGPKRKMTSAIARWHSSTQPPSDALEQAYADQLEAEMQEMAIQLHKRCEEVESLQGQVSQEKELRTVMEGCLMEDKMAWRRVHSELVETHRLAQDMSTALEKVQVTVPPRTSLPGRQGRKPGTAWSWPGTRQAGRREDVPHVPVLEILGNGSCDEECKGGGVVGGWGGVEKDSAALEKTLTYVPEEEASHPCQPNKCQAGDFSEAAFVQVETVELGQTLKDLLQYFQMSQPLKDPVSEDLDLVVTQT
ncbi:hypothetical protein JZ751_026228 [Albula glossodonta]|uniref:SAM domain-containing protein n=1 Tax=Albula glossodonta TaxID=121402 RepID=A0A8T2PBG7_9TELE|nr:hypothetical protein JZ751_026228 [Albula glossodonta]